MRKIILATLFVCLGSTLQAVEISKRLHVGANKVTIRIEGFTAKQERTIERALDFLDYRLWEIKREMPRRSTTRYESCVAKYSTKDWRTWNKDVTTKQNKESNAFWTYNDVSVALTEHSDSGRPITIVPINEEGKVWGRAAVGWYPNGKPVPELSIKLNTYNLDKHPTRDANWAGTIFHEYLHRVGYRHPTGYPGSLIKEAGSCIARKFADAPRTLRGQAQTIASLDTDEEWVETDESCIEE